MSLEILGASAWHGGWNLCGLWKLHPAVGYPSPNPLAGAVVAGAGLTSHFRFEIIIPCTLSNEFGLIRPDMSISLC